jgi:uncharacterized membrane protein YhhN
MEMIVFSVLSLGALLSGSGYLWALHRQNRLLRYILKPGTMFFIIAIAALHWHPADPIAGWMLLGLIFSVVGDIFLLIPHRFIQGLIAFFTAHSCYVAAFTMIADEKQPVLWLAVPVLAVMAFVFYSQLASRVEQQGGKRLSYAVISYITVISLMVFTALATGIAPLIAGALSFYVSDAVLAWNRFKHPFRGANHVVMVTYYLAQYLFVVGLVCFV